MPSGGILNVVGARVAPRRRRRRIGAGIVVTGLALVVASVTVIAAPAADAARAGSHPDAVVPASAVAGPPTDAQIGNLGYGLAGPRGITTGSDGNLWFVEVGGQSSSSAWISRATPSGVITHFPEVGFVLGDSIVNGPDGNLWFGGAGTIARMSTAGVVTTFADPAIGFVQDITVGPDGALWFADSTKATIGRITTSGSLTAFPAAGLAGPRFIIAGPDGNLWFGSASTNKIGRMAPSGTSTSYPLAPDVTVEDLAVGPDGNVWYVGNGTVGKVTMGGVASQVVSDNSRPSGILVGPDGTLWLYLAWATDHLAHISADGVITPIPTVPAGGLAPMRDLTLGPDGAVWFTQETSIGSITAAGVAVVHRGIPVVDPDDVKASPDGDVVFTNQNSIGRASSDGTITELVDPSGATIYPGLMTIGSDRNIWFSGGFALQRMARDGTGTTYYVNDGTSGITGLASGSDGWLWFTTVRIGNPFDPHAPPPVFTIGRMSVLGVVEERSRSVGVGASNIVAGPDGNLWFIWGTNALGRIDPGGALATFAPAGVTRIERLTAGPDGNMWFTTGTGATIGRTTPQGVTTLFPTGALTPRAIGAGPDGNVWFTSWPNDAIGRVTPDGVVSGITDTTVDHATSIATGPDGALYFTNQGNNSIGRVALAPAAPVQVAAAPGTTAAQVSWSAPPASGGLPITGYRVAASPGGGACTTTGALTCTVRGLTPGTAYTFTVTATNAVGSGATSLPSVPVTPGRGGRYHPLTPVRVLDSRTSTGSWSAPLVAGSPRDLQIAGVGGAPGEAAAVVMNVTATGASANSFVTAWPAGESPPTASNLNFGTGETIPNLVTVKLGIGGKVSFANAVGAVDLVADLVGYYDDGIGAGDGFNAISPTRFLDSRGATGDWNAPLVAGSPRDLVVRQPGRPTGVPASATAVVVNVTATGASEGSFLSVWPSGVARPGVSNLNFAAGQTIPNLAIVKIGDNGSIRFANATGTVDVVADVVAYFDPTAGARFHAINPTRVLDDRVGKGVSGPWGPAQSRTLALAGVPGSNVAADATGVVLNVTATGATEGSFVTVHPSGVTRPTSSNLNFGIGQTIPNLVMTGVGSGGAIDLWNAAGSVDLVADAVGYFRPEPGP